MKTKYLNLSLVFCLVLGSLLTAYPVNAQTTEWPPVDFWNEPGVPSIFDSVSFGLYDFPPLKWKCLWNFGDGTTCNECWVNQAKQFKTDGDYTVNVQVTNEHGKTVPVSRVVSVRTHDVAIIKFTVPQSASAGQTRIHWRFATCLPPPQPSRRSSWKMTARRPRLGRIHPRCRPPNGRQEKSEPGAR